MFFQFNLTNFESSDILSVSNTYTNGATKDILSVSNTYTNGSTLPKPVALAVLHRVDQWDDSFHYVNFVLHS